MSRSEINILHMSDPHFQMDNADHLADTILQSTQIDTAIDTAIDFIAITGDITAKKEPNGYEIAHKFLRRLIENSTSGLDESRILLIPGNHDATVPAMGNGDMTHPKWIEYGDFVSKWYGLFAGPSERIINVPLKDKSGKILPKSAYIINHYSDSDRGVVFLLLNSLAGFEENDQKIRETYAVDGSGKLDGMGYVGRNQLAAFESALDEAEIGKSVPKVALLHHHLFPIRPYGETGDDLLRRNLLIDFPEVFEWLGAQSCICVLHGHRHLPFMAAHSVRRHDYKVIRSYLKALPPSEAPAEKNAEIIVCGVGSLQEEIKAKEGLVKTGNLQLVSVNTRPVPYYEVKVTATPFYRIVDDWVNRREGQASSERVYSNPTLPEFLKKLFDAESFLASSMTVRKLYPLVATLNEARDQVKVDELFWTPLANAKRVWIDKDTQSNAVWDLVHDRDVKRGDFVRYSEDCPRNAGTAREAVLQQLIGEIKTKNRSHSIFSIMPFQLKGIYAYAAIFFSDEDIDKWAEIEFGEPEWTTMLEPVRGIPDRFRDHIDAANKVIAENVADGLIGPNPAVDRLRILEIGFGALRTIQYVMKGVSDYYHKTLKKTFPHDFRFEYLGYDVNQQLKEAAAKKLIHYKTSKSDDTHLLRMTAPFPSMKEDEMLKKESAYEALRHAALDKFMNSVDCFLTSYCMHHVSNNGAILTSLLDGTFFEIIGEEYFEREKDRFPDAIMSGSLFPAVEDRKREELASKLDAARHHFQHALDNRERDEYGVITNDAYRGFVKEIHEEYFPNRQDEILKRVWDLLRDFGYICIADPDGYSSTFNRYRIINDWPLSVAHFTEWPEVVRALYANGFDKFKVYRQIRLRNLEALSIRVPEEFVIRAKTDPLSIDIADINATLFNSKNGEPELDPLEIEDQHLGYIIIAQKIPR